ncbi:MAG: beta-ketoacyl synthase N-terminal-like domain-containing protein [Myxococcota bacterium]|nr:beta-ketoacyl synthase N-terminal-like domain-containing protein [Myxococcota bacterium]
MTSSSRRVVVTGLGVASAFGVGRPALVEGLASGRSAIGPMEGLRAELPPGLGGQLDLPTREFRNYFDTRVLRLSTMTRQTILGCIACGDLLQDAGLSVDDEVHPTRGAYLGSFIMPPAYIKQFNAMNILARRPDGQELGYVLDDADLEEALKKASAFDFLRALPNMPSSHLSIQAGAQGPTCTYLGSDSSGIQAITMAAGAISDGLADSMIAGGAFCPYQEVHLAWQFVRGLYSETGAVQPYAEGRTGTVPGEGAGLLYLEEREQALARGATILAEVIGSGQRLSPKGAGEDVSMRADTLRAALPSGQPDWIGAGATGHGQLDQLEAEGYIEAFGEDGLAESGLVTITDQVGFSGPACSPMNLISALLAARGEVVPHRDTSLDADEGACAALASAIGRSGKVGGGSVVLGSSFSLDGVHAAIAMRVEG